MLNVLFGKPKRYSRIYTIHLNTLEIRLQINRMFSYGPVLSLSRSETREELPSFWWPLMILRHQSGEQTALHPNKGALLVWWTDLKRTDLVWIENFLFQKVFGPTFSGEKKFEISRAKEDLYAQKIRRLSFSSAIWKKSKKEEKLATTWGPLKPFTIIEPVGRRRIIGNFTDINRNFVLDQITFNEWITETLRPRPVGLAENIRVIGFWINLI